MRSRCAVPLSVDLLGDCWKLTFCMLDNHTEWHKKSRAKHILLKSRKYFLIFFLEKIWKFWNFRKSKNRKISKISDFQKFQLFKILKCLIFQKYIFYIFQNFICSFFSLEISRNQHDKSKNQGFCVTRYGYLMVCGLCYSRASLICMIMTFSCTIWSESQLRRLLVTGNPRYRGALPCNIRLSIIW